MDRSHFRRASSPNLDARDLARLAKLEPSMQAQYRAQKAAKASSSLRSSDFAVPVSRTPTRSKDKREKRSKGDLLTHLMSMLTPSEEVKALNEIRMVVASEQQSAQRDELAEDQVVAESPLSSSADGSVSPSRSPSPASGSCAAAPSSATTSPTAAAGAAASTATTPTGSGGSIPRSESDPHLATHIAGLLLAHGDDSRTADMKISDHLNSTLCFAASTGNLLVAKRALMYGAHIDGVNYDQRYDTQPPLLHTRHLDCRMRRCTRTSIHSLVRAPSFITNHRVLILSLSVSPSCPSTHTPVAVMVDIWLATCDSTELRYISQAPMAICRWRSFSSSKAPTCTPSTATVSRRSTMHC